MGGGVRHVGFQVYQKLSKSARKESGKKKKLGCLLFVSACIAPGSSTTLARWLSRRREGEPERFTMAVAALVLKPAAFRLKPR